MNNNQSPHQSIINKLMHPLTSAEVAFVRMVLVEGENNLAPSKIIEVLESSFGLVALNDANRRLMADNVLVRNVPVVGEPFVIGIHPDFRAEYHLPENSAIRKQMACGELAIRELLTTGTCACSSCILIELIRADGKAIGLDEMARQLPEFMGEVSERLAKLAENGLVTEVKSGYILSEAFGFDFMLSKSKFKKPQEEQAVNNNHKGQPLLSNDQLRTMIKEAFAGPAVPDEVLSMNQVLANNAIKGTKGAATDEEYIVFIINQLSKEVQTEMPGRIPQIEEEKIVTTFHIARGDKEDMMPYSKALSNLVECNAVAITGDARLPRKVAFTYEFSEMVKLASQVKKPRPLLEAVEEATNQINKYCMNLTLSQPASMFDCLFYMFTTVVVAEDGLVSFMKELLGDEFPEDGAEVIAAELKEMEEQGIIFLDDGEYRLTQYARSAYVNSLANLISKHPEDSRNSLLFKNLDFNAPGAGVPVNVQIAHSYSELLVDLNETKMRDAIQRCDKPWHLATFWQLMSMQNPSLEEIASVLHGHPWVEPNATLETVREHVIEALEHFVKQKVAHKVQDYYAPNAKVQAIYTTTTQPGKHQPFASLADSIAAPWETTLRRYLDLVLGLNEQNIQQRMDNAGDVMELWAICGVVHSQTTAESIAQYILAHPYFPVVNESTLVAELHDALSKLENLGILETTQPSLVAYKTDFTREALAVYMEMSHAFDVRKDSETLKQRDQENAQYDPAAGLLSMNIRVKGVQFEVETLRTLCRMLLQMTKLERSYRDEPAPSVSVSGLTFTQREARVFLAEVYNAGLFTEELGNMTYGDVSPGFENPTFPRGRMYDMRERPPYRQPGTGTRRRGPF